MKLKKIYKDQKILIDPHTAVAIGALNKIFLDEETVILSTAHPAKFSETVLEQTNVQPQLPENLKNILINKEKYEKLPNDLKIIQNYILKNI